MKHTLLLVAVLLAAVGCSRKTDEQVTKNKPEDPVSGFFAALEARDSAHAAGFLSSDLLSSTRAMGDSVLRKYLVLSKDVHIQVKVIGVSLDSITKRLAKVYVNETYSQDTFKRTLDSIYYYAENEGGVWKLSSFRMQKDMTK